MIRTYKHIPLSVFILGCVSFLTDLSSHMIYPFLPIFLTQYLFAAQGFVGIIEGFAESASAFFTLCSGFFADRSKDRSRIVLLGYSLSCGLKPLMAVAGHPWVVFFIRFFDRMGKGIRTSPRDALIADSVEPEHRGRAFGLQRSMDNAGAVAGPVVATLLLTFWITNLRHLFALAAIPGVLAVLLILWKVREVKPVLEGFRGQEPFRLKPPSGKLRIYLSILFLFILSCSSDAFLLLRASQLGVPTALLPMIWMLLNTVSSLTTLPFGMLSDRIGRRRTILMGWMIYAFVYLGFAFADQAWHAWALFGCYGLYYGLTEGSERAMLADYAAVSERGQTYGWYYFIVGMGALPASCLFGFLWQSAGFKTAFLVSACISSAAILLLAFFVWKVPSHSHLHPHPESA